MAELKGIFYSYALFGMIVEWIKGGFKYSSSYMADQLLKIINANHRQH
ncbi:TetR-like C-terminal domain-containing protein [Neobacillus niacini]|nr:TetR-like C-terminal domain-containing protein [Neobacillus niacini]